MKFLTNSVKVYLLCIITPVLCHCGPAQMAFRNIQPNSLNGPNGNNITNIIGGGPATPTTSMTCLSWTALSPNSTGLVVVPPRDASQSCYYIKLFDAVGYLSSSTETSLRTDMIATNWDGQTPFPKVIGSVAGSPGATKSISLLMQGARSALFSSDSKGLFSTTVDNFYLLETGSDFWAAGTRDCVPAGGMRVAGNLVNFIAVTPGGTASIPVTDISPILSLNVSMNFRASGLDCGGVAATSDTYLVFQ